LRSRQRACRDWQDSESAAPERASLAHRLFCGCDLFDRRSFDFGLLALCIGVVQEPIDDARALLLLDPSILRFLLLFIEEFVVDFPTHLLLHLLPNQRHNNAYIVAYGSDVLPGQECIHQLETLTSYGRYLLPHLLAKGVNDEARSDRRHRRGHFGCDGWRG